MWLGPCGKVLLRWLDWERYEWGFVHAIPAQRRGQGSPSKSERHTREVAPILPGLADVVFSQVFINHPSTKERFDRLLPFQVFAGWNGITVLSPTPFLPPYNVQFRRGATAPPGSGLSSADVECQQSECGLISWDFWKYGFGRIQVVPGVHATYSKADAMMRGWIEFPLEEEGYTEAITWQDR